ncbi:MAG: N-6 DNA methylase [Acidimicrobiales bacterium]
MATSSPPVVGPVGDRARAIAGAAVRLAAATGRSLPDDLQLWALAGGRPVAGGGPSTGDGVADQATAQSEAPDDGHGGADLAVALEAATHADVRRVNGLHVTPRWLADQLAARALDGMDGLPATTACDPACGGGAFLLAAARRLHRRGADRRRIVRHLLWGADIDPVGLAVAEVVLALWAGEAPPPGRLVVADSLAVGAAAWPDPPPAGFDVVVGNPPFQNQLGRSTARSRVEQQRLRARFGDAVRAYTDAAWLFLLLGCELTRPGGRVVLIQPQSLVAARDAAAVRDAVDGRARLRTMWVDERPVFAAAVRVCAPVLDVLDDRERGGRQGDAGPAWSARFADAVGVPEVDMPSGPTLADHADVFAGFRDEYYGLVDLVSELDPAVDVDGSAPDGVAPLVTCGSIDWLGSSWGRRPSRFAKRAWRAPVVDLGRLEAEGPRAARRWVERTRVPKLVVATQTRVLETAVDDAGAWVPSVPVLSVVPHARQDVWRLAAALAAPASTAWLMRRAPGTALARGALKVAAPDLLDLPLPTDERAWDDATAALCELVAHPSAHRREAFLAAASAAYGTPVAVTAWWRERARVASPEPTGRRAPMRH